MSEENQEYLKSEHLAVGYRGKALIEEIELSLKKGEIVTLIGPNGAGKSTILKSIAGQLKLISGDVVIGDSSILKMSEKDMASKMSIVFTERITPELITVFDVVALGRYPYTKGIGRLKETDYKKIEEAMKLVQITDLKEHEFGHLSDGQKQRVLLAKAICQEPEVLLLDEPTSYLDMKYKLELFSVLQGMTRQKKMGVLMSLHELDLAMRISDKILCIHGNQVERYGTPEEIFKDGYAEKLYDMKQGTFLERTGSVELEKNVGKSQVFVIAGNYTGGFVFDRLQRKGIPFSVGILAEHDLDYPKALALANHVISVPAYEEFTEEHYQLAEREMLSCQEVICTQSKFGPQNEKNYKLLCKARESGMKVTNG